MPGQNAYDTADLPDELQDYLKHYESEQVKKMPREIVLPKKDIETQKQEDYIRQLKRLTQDELTKQRKHSEVEQMRREMRKELGDIKDAVRKLGVLLDGDKPSEKVLREHKMLRDAYNKYRMIENLILGKGTND